MSWQQNPSLALPIQVSNSLTKSPVLFVGHITLHGLVPRTLAHSMTSCFSKSLRGHEGKAAERLYTRAERRGF